MVPAKVQQPKQKTVLNPVKKDRSRSQAPRINQRTEAAVVDVVNSNQVRYFDYDKLNNDLSRISAVLERFNNHVSQEIQQLKQSKREDTGDSSDDS
jgi:hypothetical protein